LKRIFDKIDVNDDKVLHKGELAIVLKRWQTFSDAGDVGSEFSAPVPQKKSKIPLWQFFLAGGMGGVMSRTATAPLDKLKILAQTQGT